MLLRGHPRVYVTTGRWEGWLFLFFVSRFPAKVCLPSGRVAIYSKLDSNMAPRCVMVKEHDTLTHAHTACLVSGIAHNYVQGDTWKSMKITNYRIKLKIVRKTIGKYLSNLLEFDLGFWYDLPVHVVFKIELPKERGYLLVIYIFFIQD